MSNKNVNQANKNKSKTTGISLQKLINQYSKPEKLDDPIMGCGGKNIAGIATISYTFNPLSDNKYLLIYINKGSQRGNSSTLDTGLKIAAEKTISIKNNTYTIYSAILFGKLAKMSGHYLYERFNSESSEKNVSKIPTVIYNDDNVTAGNSVGRYNLTDSVYLVAYKLLEKSPAEESNNLSNEGTNNPSVVSSNDNSNASSVTSEESSNASSVASTEEESNNNSNASSVASAEEITPESVADETQEANTSEPSPKNLFGEISNENFEPAQKKNNNDKEVVPKENSPEMKALKNQLEAVSKSRKNKLNKQLSYKNYSRTNRVKNNKIIKSLKNRIEKFRQNEQQKPRQGTVKIVGKEGKIVKRIGGKNATRKNKKKSNK
jgi:hypothetical protein